MELFSHNLKTKTELQSVVLAIVFRATSNNAQSWCNMINIPGRRQSIFDLRLSIVLTFSIAAYPVFVCLFVLLYVPCQQLWSLRDGQFT